MIKSNQEACRMRISLPKRFNVEWMLNHIRTSSYGLPYRFVDHCILRRPLWLAGAPVVAEFDLSQAGTMGLRLVPLRGHAAGRARRKPPYSTNSRNKPYSCGASTMLLKAFMH